MFSFLGLILFQGAILSPFKLKDKNLLQNPFLFVRVRNEKRLLFSFFLFL